MNAVEREAVRVYVALLREQGFGIMADESEALQEELDRDHDHTVRSMNEAMQREPPGSELYLTISEALRHYCQARDKHSARIVAAVNKATTELVLYKEECLKRATQTRSSGAP